MKTSNKSIYNHISIVVVCILFFVQPAYFEQIGWLDKLYTYGGFVCTIFLLLLLLIDRKITFGRVWIVLFFGTILVSTLVGSGELYRYAKAYYPLLGTCLLFELWAEYNIKVLLEGTKILNIYIYINLITVLMYPEGMYNDGMYNANWFLGYKNPQIRIILPVIALELIRSYWKYRKISAKTYILLVCAAVTFLRIDSATALIGFVLFALLLFLFHKKNKTLPKLMNLKNCAIASFVVFVSIVMFQVQNQFSWFFENILGRDLTLTTRTYIWGKAFTVIKEHFLLGIGYLSATEYGIMFGNIYATHPHNYFLYIAMSGGLVLVIVLLVGIWYSDRKLSAHMDNIYSKIILFVMYSFFVMGIAESLVSTVLLYPMLILAMNADKLAELKYEKQSVPAFGIRIKVKK